MVSSTAEDGISMEIFLRQGPASSILTWLDIGGFRSSACGCLPTRQGTRPSRVGPLLRGGLECRIGLIGAEVGWNGWLWYRERDRLPIVGGAAGVSRNGY